MSETARATARLPAWQKLGLAVIFLMIISYSLMGELEVIGLNTGLLPGGEPPGLLVDLKRDGWLDVMSVTPGAPAATTGIRAGDRIRYDDRYRHGRNWLAGEHVGVTVDHGGHIDHRVIVTPPLGSDPESQKARTLNIVTGISGLVTLGFGILVLWRGRKSPPALLLAAVLIALSGTAHYMPIWTRGLPFELLFLVPSIVTLGVHVVYPSFCLLIAGDGIPLVMRRVLHGVVGLFVLIELTTLYTLFQAEPVLGLFPGLDGLVDIEFLLIPFALAILLYGLRGRGGAERNRIGIVLVAILCYALGLALGIKLPITVTPTGWLLFDYILVQTLLKVVAPALLAYVVLRQRLLDLGFAVNRTLVYGIVSFILLAAFGLTEKAVDALIPEEWHKGSALYSAGIALILFLSFHRLRDWIEHQVERLFFQSWHRNEAKLRQFVARAAHYERSDRLVADAAAEFSRFAGAHAAFYWREADGDFSLQGGALDTPCAHIDADDPAAVAMRADNAPVEPEAGGSVIPAALALPMIDHGLLIGFIALGAKPNSPGYRPDEREVMAWAAQQIGLDSQSMRARDLEARLAETTQDLAVTRAQNERLHALLGGNIKGKILPAG